QRHWHQARWFIDLVGSQKLSGLKQGAEFLASTKGGSALKEENIDEALRQVQAEAKTFIEWCLDEKTKGIGVRHAPLDPVEVELLPCLVGNRFETSMIAQGLRARLLLVLFDLLSAEKRVFAL